MFIIEKRNGDIKARKSAVGSKQRTFPGYVKSEWASPTVSTDSVIIPSAIEAHQGRDVAVAPPVPTMFYLAVAARENPGLAPTTGVSQPAGVVSTGVVDLTDVTDDDDVDSGTILVPKVEVEDIPTVEVNDEQETAQAQFGLGHSQYGREMRIWKKLVSYEPVMTGKTYQRGVNNLCYRGTGYTLNEVVPFGNMP